MAIFSRIDKKILTILILTIAVILLAGFGAYKYMSNHVVKVQDSVGGAQTEQRAGNASGQDNSSANVQQIQIQAGGVQAEGSGTGTLSVCVDNCGDGICQKTDPACGKDNNLNCVCPETPQDCPKDCK